MFFCFVLLFEVRKGKVPRVRYGNISRNDRRGEMDRKRRGKRRQTQVQQLRGEKLRNIANEEAKGGCSRQIGE